MTSDTTAPARNTHASGIPIGLALGVALGGLFDEVAIGIALGLVAGGTFSMWMDYRGKVRSGIWPAFGVLAFVSILATFIIGRP